MPLRRFVEYMLPLDLLDLLLCRVPVLCLQHFVSFLDICDASPLQLFLPCARSVILARSLHECSQIGCSIRARSLLNTFGKVVFAVYYHLLCVTVSFCFRDAWVRIRSGRGASLFLAVVVFLRIDFRMLCLVFCVLAVSFSSFWAVIFCMVVFGIFYCIWVP